MIYKTGSAMQNLFLRKICRFSGKITLVVVN